jgi:hypothetical protein
MAEEILGFKEKSVLQDRAVEARLKEMEESVQKRGKAFEKQVAPILPHVSCILIRPDPLNPPF